jgi:hypothetical protein
VPSTNDATLIGDVVAEALLRGVDDKELAGAVRHQVSLAKGSLSARPAEAQRARAEIDGIGRLQASLAWSRVAKLPAAAPFAVRAALLGLVLERDAEHGEASAEVKRFLPADLPQLPAFDATQWLGFAAAHQQTGLRFVTEPADGAQPDREQQELARLRETWRKDLMGVVSDRLFVVAPVTVPAAVSRCLSMGELVCSVLERMFAPRGSVRAGAQRLEVLLFESREEYLAKAGQREDDKSLQWTAGYYSPEESLSRLFLPSGEEGLRYVMQTFAHELTHHWLEERGPRLEPVAEKRETLLVQKGYWIVEGFASFVEDFVWDLDARACEEQNPRSHRLDLLAHTDVEQRLPWAKAFGISHAQFATRLDKKSEMVVPSTWRLGRYFSFSAAAVFYAQAAATCNYLYHAEGGKHRAALLDYVLAYYSGHGDRLGVADAFGLEEVELGQRVVAHAQAVVR